MMCFKNCSDKIIFIVSIFIVLGACSPVVHTRGNLVDDNRLPSITEGVSRKADVTAVLGTPTTIAPFNENLWYYVGEKTADKAFLEHEVTQRRIITVEFDDTGTVQTIKDIDQSNAEDIEMVDATTPTAGKKMNMFQQFLSNLGRFNTAGEANTGL